MSGRLTVEPRRVARWWHLVIVASLSLGLYAQTAGYGFVYDDNVQIVLNQRIRSFSNLGKAFAENFWAFSSPRSFTNYYRPLQTVTYMVGYALGRLSPSAYHWISILLNVLACLAVLWVGWELFRSATIALWGALLFTAHPMHTESVAWIAGVTDVGCGLFYFVSVGAYLRYRCGGPYRLLWQGISLLSFLAALLYKEMALTLPLVIVFLDYATEALESGIRLATRLRRFYPFFVILTIYMVLRVHALGAFARTVVPLQIGVVDRLLTMLYFVARYLTDLILPVRHNAFHVFEPFFRLRLVAWAPPLLVLIAGVVLVWIYLRQDKKLVGLAVSTVVTLIPVLNLGGVGQNIYTERYLYIPSLGFCLLLAALTVRLLGRSTRLAWVAAAVVVLLLSFLTVRRNTVWKDNKTLYRATLSVSPGAALIHNNLGTVLFAERNYAAAKKEFQAGLEAVSETFVDSRRDRATSLLGLSSAASAEGRLEEAWKYAEEARALMPDLSESYNVLGVLRGKQGRFAEAEKLLRHALKLQPDDPVVHVNLGSTLMFEGDYAAGEREMRKALELDPGSAGARVALAMLLSETNRKAEALFLLREALNLDPANAQARRLYQTLTGS